MEGRKPIMQFFDYEHLPKDLQEVSKPFGDLARLVHDKLYPHNGEVMKALDKLLEAKDAAVRAQLLNRRKQGVQSGA